MAGRVILVAGGNGGIGYQSALYLAQLGASVLIAARDTKRTDAAVEAIKTSTGNGKVIGIELDLGSLDSIHACSVKVQEALSGWQQPLLHGAILNAGIINNTLEYTPHGIEATFAINHLGHFYLTKLLLPLLAPDARIVVTSSGMHDPAMVKGPWPKPEWHLPSELAMMKEPSGEPHPAAANYHGLGAYTKSKLCNVLFTYYLSNWLQQQGSAVTVVAYNPGYVRGTSIMRSSAAWKVTLASFIVPWFMWFKKIHTLTVEQAGTSQARLAVDPEFQGVTGVYYNLDEQIKSSVDSYDKEKQQQLWEYSEQLLKELGAKSSI